MKKKVLSLMLALALCVGLLPTALAANGQPAVTDNLDKNSYVGYCVSTIKSYLYENSDGGLTRVEYMFDYGTYAARIFVEDYDSQFRLQGTHTVPIKDLSIWGGFYAGKDYNFLIFGADNAQEDDNKEVIRVIKYDKNWNQLGYASLYGANTVAPFSSGTLRCAEGNGYLYIRTCHKMYKSQKDGKNHQASLMLALRESDMTFTKDYWDSTEINVGYVSHSFNQFILVDRNDRIISLDHGDGYPRAALLQRYSAKAGAKSFNDHDNWVTTYYDNGSYSTSRQTAEEVNLVTFPGAIGLNSTGCNIGGLAETSNGYVAAYNYSGTGNGNPTTVYLSFIDEDLKVKTVPLTGSEQTKTPVLAPLGLNGGYVMWHQREGYTNFEMNNTLYYAHYDANGNVGPVQTTKGSLSDCAPIYWNGKAVWYVTNESAPVFYTLDASGNLQTYSATGSSTQTTPPTTPNQSTSFSDVPSSHWAYSYIQSCASKGIVSGIGNGEFSPEGQVTYAQFCVMVINAFYPELLDKSAGGSWYTPYMNAARKAGLLSGTAAASSDTSANVSMTRYDMAQALCNALTRAGITATSSQKSAAQSSIKDWNQVPVKYQDAVSTCFALKLLSGMGDGSFGGSQTMTRAQACVVIAKLDEVLTGGPAEVRPTVTTKDIEVTTKETQWGTGYYVEDNGFGTGYLNNGKSITEANVKELLKKAESIWPTGISWLEPSTYNNHWYQWSGSVVDSVLLDYYHISPNYVCGGFAAMVSDYLFSLEDNPAHRVTDSREARPGDILVKMADGQADHVSIIISNDNGVILTADGNINGKVVWSQSQANPSGASWEIWSRYPN